jgi:hypothetical protein
MPLHAHTKQYAILSGEMYFEPLVNGIYQGERYLGNAPSAELSIEPQKLDHYDADSNEVSKDFSFASRVDRTMSLTLDDMSEENAALFFSASASTVTQTAVAVVDESIANVQPGRYYQLGQTTGNPTGVRNVGSVSVKVGAVVKVLNTDYLVDLVRGRVYIVAGGTIAADATILVSYTPVANTRRRLASGAGTTVEGRMRFLANNLAGANRDYYFPSVSVTPSGSFQLKGGGENPQVGTLGLAVEILKPANAEAIYIDGQAA